MMSRRRWRPRAKGRRGARDQDDGHLLTTVRLSDVVDGAPNGIVFFDDNVVVWANPAARALLAPSGAALEGRTLEQLLPPSSDRTHGGLLSPVAGISTPVGHLDLVDTEGEVVTVVASVSGVEGDEGPMLLLHFRDVREELAAGWMMAERERFLAGIFQNAGVGIVVTDTDGTIRDANTTFREYVGRDLPALIGRPFADLLGQDEREEGARILQALGRGALNGFVTEHRFVRDGGDEAWGETRSAALRDGEGRVERIIIAVSDLTARRRTNATFRAVFEHSDDGYLIMRHDRVEDANAAALVLFGVDSVRSLPWPLFGLDDAPAVLTAGPATASSGPDVLDAAWAGTTQRSEWLIRRPDGSTAPAGLTLVKIQIGNEDALLGVVHDHTQQKLFEAQLVEARDDAEAAARAKADFLATMSHEIRTPMNGVLGMVDLLAETPLTPDQQRMIRTTKDSAFALLAIINDVLDFSKIEAGKLVLEQVPVGVHELGDAVTEMLGTNAANAGLTLQALVEPDVPEAFLGDPVRLRQILFNLVGNAIKFTEQGTVRIVTSVVHREGESRLRISVEDTGIGMTQQQASQLFQPFAQAESSTTRRFGGTGLGLSIVSRLVTLMGGSVSLDTTPGRGSSFHVELPLQPVEWDPDLPDLQGLHVAAVSSGSPEHEAARRTLVRAGVEVEDVTADILLDRLRSGREPADVVYLGSAMEPIERARVRGVLASYVDPLTVGVVAGVPAGASTDEPDLPDTQLVAAEPLTRAALFEAVALAARRAVRDEPALRGHTEQITREVASAAGQLLLVAEDNPTNQEVIRRQLLLLGYWADVVGDGRHALLSLREHRYAALLTDCHMPHVDGFELTAAVRASEATGGPRLPIIAITANALKGEGQRCLDEGMDDYLTKPLSMAQLAAALQRWVGPPADVASPSDTDASATVPVSDLSPSEPPMGSSMDALAVLDVDVLTRTLRGDRATAQLLLADFVPNAEALVSRAHAAVESGDAEELIRVGHTLKSSARAVGALQLGEACAQLEVQASSRPARQMGLAVQRLEDDFERLREAVTAALASSSEASS